MSTATSANSMVHQTIEAGEGILRLAPTWVPRAYMVPGRRLKLDTRDLYAYGVHRGGIDERWLASTTQPQNGPQMGADEGLSYVVNGKDHFLLRDAVAAEGDRVIGKAMFAKYKDWPVYSKFFDNMGAIPHHLHQNEEQAQLVGKKGKPEGYYFPPQLNLTEGWFPHTYFGLEPGTTKAQVKACLERWGFGDNEILALAKAYRLMPGTGWLVPPCILHAPGSLLTYEPQWGSDVLSMFQSMVASQAIDRYSLVQDIPENKVNDIDFIINLVDWDRNTDENFKDKHYIEPMVASGSESEGYIDRWIVYGTVSGEQKFSAKELTVFPGSKCTIKDAAASGVVVVQGHGRINRTKVDCPSIIRFGQMTSDEVFITAEAASAGVEIENQSTTDPLVMLRYFGPDAHSKMPEVGDHRK
jgi:hypothetical protein